MRTYLIYFLPALFVAALLSACASYQEPFTANRATVEYDLLYTMPKEPLSFKHDVLPVLEKRCIACHSCYDAPCQLKLTSKEGILRGSNKTKVYNGARLTANEPTRLFIDATTTSEWRSKDFAPILHEKVGDEPGDPIENLKNSVLYRILRLKQLQPQAHTGILNDSFDLSLDRKQSCPTLKEFNDYAVDNPEGGMPYAMPNLSRDEYTTLVHWIAQGSPVKDDLPPSKEITKQIDQWETFLNGNSRKEKLFSRYIYEHLFHAHIHFKNSDQREFYRLVRSTSPPGDKVNIIPTRRPYNDPDGDVFYRIVQHKSSIVAKTHNVYELSSQRMQRYKELFFYTDYEINELPSYQQEVASNPIKAFADIPVKSRYKFLLDDARFFIEGFIKGPVCRGQVALNVIEDHFWVAFFDPDAPISSSDDEFLKANADMMALPSELENTFDFFSATLHYKDIFREYIQHRKSYIKPSKTFDIADSMKFIWDGDGKTNKNAALTVFRHLDSASVNNGWLGDYPETAWLLDYSSLERIHYLLVAGYDVYGNVGHQLNTRLYMDFLRTEGENLFLTFLPVKKRHQLLNEWYKGLRKGNRNDLGSASWIDTELVNGYKTADEQRELYQTIEHHLGAIAGDGDFINRCTNDKCARSSNNDILRADTAMQTATKIHERLVHVSPDITFVRVLMGGKPENDRAYTILYNKAYKTVSSILHKDKLDPQRDHQFDTQTILPWLEGSYPQFFYVVKLDEIENFVERYYAISNRADYEIFVALYGIRRTNKNFWSHADWFNEQYKREQPILSGIFDLNRYQNK
tara:strand:- start:104 stop:2512 length:2409 start_codon:yes stop_codon:yes gene_type:complete